MTRAPKLNTLQTEKDAAVAARAERRERAALAERRSKAKGPGRDGQPLETIETQTDEGNEKVRRVWAVDSVERLFQSWFQRASRSRTVRERLYERYRIARSLEADWLSALHLRQPNRFHRIRPDSDEFCVMPAGIGAAAPQPRVDEARQNLKRAAAAVHEELDWAILQDFILDGRGLREIERRRRLRNGEAPMIIEQALDRVAEAQVYETRKWRVQVKKAAP
jgi:hypothetical protein